MNEQKIWKGADIVICECTDKSYKHVHCPCTSCKGRATDRKTEIRHWKEAVNLNSVNSTIKCPSSSFSASCISDDVLDNEETDQCNISDVESDENGDNYADILHEDAFAYHIDYTCRVDKEFDDAHAQENLCQNPLKKLVCKAVLDALKIKHTSGVSVKTFEEILQYGKNMLLASQSSEVDLDVLSTLWPKTWNEVQKLLKDNGYEGVKEYFICFCRKEKQYTRDGQTKKKFVYDGKYSIMENKKDKCPHCGNYGYIPYMYLGLESKVKNWFRNKEMCERMLSHWIEKEHWLDNDEEYPIKKELWDGKRWRDLKWFWNPESQWVLPTSCKHCNIPIPTEHLINSLDKDLVSNTKTVECPYCFEQFEHCITIPRGSPLNLAIMGHFDGWEPFGTSYRGSGSFEITIANMKKADRNHVDEVFVVGFVPCFEVPNLTYSLDPFLEPLMKDLCTSFIDGYKVSYPRDIVVEGYEHADHETVRVLLLCWSGDHPAQCEVGKILNQGQCPCRRCKLVGQHLENSSNTHYYYGNNRMHFRFQWEERHIECELTNMFNADHETRSSVRKKLSSKSGFTGTSILHKYLYPLYKFDILHHLVYDVFHTLPLNVVKNQLSRFLEQCLIDKTRLDQQIEMFPWTREFKDGRLPSKLGNNNKGIAYWKAESFQKFSFPMSECILESHLTENSDYEITSLVSRLSELYFHSGRNGWTASMINLHKNLAWRLNIRAEEKQGLEMCTISLHNLLHIHEDIINFSAPDNFWCAVYERAVKGYLKKSHNGKRIEATFAHAESIREHLKAVEHNREPLVNIEDHDLSKVKKIECTSHKQGVIQFLTY